MTRPKLNDAGILVAKELPAWIDTHLTPPQVGATVRVLNTDGVSCGKTVWTDDAKKYYDGWLPDNPIPPSIKARQLARYTGKLKDTP